MDNKKDDLNFNYKKISENEILLDNELNTNEKDINKNEIVAEMIKGNISDLVKNQLNINKRADLNEKAYTDNKNYTSVSKKIPWFAEYKKQTITVTKEKIRAYLRNYKDLDKLIKYRKKKIESGEIRPESNELNLEDFEKYNFLEDSKIDEKTFLTSTDYKIQEMEFYRKELMMILKYLKNIYLFRINFWYLNII